MCPPNCATFTTEESLWSVFGQDTLCYYSDCELLCSKQFVLFWICWHTIGCLFLPHIKPAVAAGMGLWVILKIKPLIKKKHGHQQLKCSPFRISHQVLVDVFGFICKSHHLCCFWKTIYGDVSDAAEGMSCVRWVGSGLHQTQANAVRHFPHFMIITLPTMHCKNVITCNKSLHTQVEE